MSYYFDSVLQRTLKSSSLVCTKNLHKLKEASGRFLWVNVCLNLSMLTCVPFSLIRMSWNNLNMAILEVCRHIKLVYSLIFCFYIILDIEPRHQFQCQGTFVGHKVSVQHYRQHHVSSMYFPRAPCGTFARMASYYSVPHLTTLLRYWESTAIFMIYVRIKIDKQFIMWCQPQYCWV